MEMKLKALYLTYLYNLFLIHLSNLATCQQQVPVGGPLEPLTLLIRAVQHQQQQQLQLQIQQHLQSLQFQISQHHHQQQRQKQLDPGRELNVTQLLFHRFQFLFKDIPASIRALYEQVELSNSTSSDIPVELAQSVNADSLSGNEQSNLLETRGIQMSLSNNNNNIDSTTSGTGDSSNKRSYLKVINRVFSRVELPQVYKSNSRSKSGHCALHIGCVEEIPNFPSLLKKANVSSLFTIYNRNSPRSGLKILYEPLLHHQLQDGNISEIELEEKLRVTLGTNVNTPISPVISLPLATNRLVSNYLGTGRRPAAHHHHHQQQVNGLPVSSASWRSAVKIVRSQEYPFDMSALEQSGFNASLNTRIIVGGYFAKEDEEWIDEVVRQWLLLEPSNIIKVSWADANRGLYHTAAYNSRIVGRQLSLFLYYLNEMFSIDLNRFHLVGHSLGAHIAGFVGADNGGKIARITGLDPAGPIFVELNASMRLDPTDAQFVDVVHTNGGTITKGALGLSTPSGHVDYYCNGGNLQPGCYFSSVTKSIMDPVERVACSHRRSYRYFIEIIKLAIGEQAAAANAESHGDGTSSPDISSTGSVNRSISHNPQHLSQLPRAFLFEAKHEELVKLSQPEIVLMSQQVNSVNRRELNDREYASLAPLKKRLEFHLLKPEFPANKRGMYFFKTRSEAPFFATKQYALTLRTDSLVKRKIALLAKIDQTVVAEAELDEIPGIYTLAFAPNDPRTIDLNDESRAPQLSLMWKHRSFNLLLSSQQNELRLSGLELSLLDSDFDQQPIIRYMVVNNSQLTSSRQASSSGTAISLQSTSSGAAGTAKSGSSTYTETSGDLALARNQWYKFEGRWDRAPHLKESNK